MRDGEVLGTKPTGKHPDKRLSAVMVRALKDPGRYADGNGLYLVVDPSGAKRWVLRTIVKGKRCDIGLGGFALVSLAQARDEAARLRKIARNHGDPLAERRAARKKILTFEQAARQVHNEHKPSWKNPKHADQWINTLTEYVFPVFGSKQVDAVETNDVKAALLPIWLTKSETARRVRQRINMVFDWSKATGLRQGDNPCDGLGKVLPKQPDVEEHHTALPYPEVPGFVVSLHKSVATDEAIKLAFEMLILTAARTAEVIQATWTEIDTDNAVWTIPASRMKAKQEHRVPLSPRCLAILKHAKQLAGESEFLFPGRTAGKSLSNMAFLMTLRRMNLNITAHGFRSSFRDWAAEQTNFPREVCEMALAHTVRDKVEAAYRRTDLFDKRRELMAAWSAFVTMVAR
jgi:integrase